MKSLTIVKRKGKDEVYDERKIYASCYYACLNASIEHHKAEKVCEKVAKDVTSWVTKRKTVSSNRLFKQMTQVLKKTHPEVGYMYETHRDIC